MTVAYDSVPRFFFNLQLLSKHFIQHNDFYKNLITSIVWVNEENQAWHLLGKKSGIRLLINIEGHMNVYSCCYKGNYGYCCRRYNHSWMFVPELGQSDNNIYKNVAFDDFIFKNKYAEEYERDFQSHLERSNTTGLLKKILRKKFKPQTIGGLLFCVAGF